MCHSLLGVMLKDAYSATMLTVCTLASCAVAGESSMRCRLPSTAFINNSTLQTKVHSMDLGVNDVEAISSRPIVVCRFMNRCIAVKSNHDRGKFIGSVSPPGNREAIPWDRLRQSR